MKSTVFILKLFITALFLTIFPFCSLLPTQSHTPTVDKVFSAIVLNGSSAKYVNNEIPVPTLATSPIISTSSRIRKGETLFVDISVPDNAQSLYLSASAIKANYLNIGLGNDTDEVMGYYKIDLSSAQPLAKKTAQVSTQDSSTLAKTYSLKILTNNDFYMNSFDVVFAYQTPDGISRYVQMPISIDAIMPYKNQVHVGFRPPEGVEDYTVTINCPRGAVVSYHGGVLSGISSDSLYYDKALNVYWIKLPPVMGPYTVTISADFVFEQNKVISMLALVMAAGKIDNLDINLNVVGNPVPGKMCTGFFIINFRFGPIPVVKMTAFRYPNKIDRYTVKDTSIPDDIKHTIGAGVRVNGANNTKINWLNLVRTELSITDGFPDSDIAFKLRRLHGTLRIWKDHTRINEIELIGNEATLDFSTSKMKNVFMEMPSPGENSEISFECSRLSDGTIISADTILYYPFRSIIICIRGADLPTETAWPQDKSQGVFWIGDSLYLNGYDVRKYNNTDVNTAGSTPIEDIIWTSDINNVVLIGFSHGGGSIYNLSFTINDYITKNLLPKLIIPITCYIDAISTTLPFSSNCVDKRPIASNYHINFYQRGIAGTGINICFCAGCETLSDGSNMPTRNILIDNVNHCTISQNSTVIHNALSAIYQYCPEK